MRCAHSAVDYLTDAGGSGPGKRRGGGGAEVEGNPYCTGRSTAGSDVCVCVCLHLLVIGRGRESGGECPLLAL